MKRLKEDNKEDEIR